MQAIVRAELAKTRPVKKGQIKLNEKFDTQLYKGTNLDKAKKTLY